MQLDKVKIQKNFDRYASLYDENSRLQKRVAMELCSRAKFRGKVLDIGAGTGFIKNHTGWDITNLDISPKMCELAGEGAICADAAAIPLPDESFDNVISSLTIQWISDLRPVAEEIKRLLKPNGNFAISTFVNGSLEELKSSFSFLDNSEHVLEFESPLRLFAVLKQAGFHNITMHSQNITYHYNSVREILNSMKYIGASYQNESMPKGLRGKQYFEKLENVYRAKYEKNAKLPVSWVVSYITGKK
ncbi:MAG: hypothetical protein COV36_06275 [Alphaproteobacteria bacterium CG11_big_fil_rev_8_21_14_0_20_44_7]|nr:MAG: hypothetical protein COV36_06275 [Alphaproteobacteria bacterium CG11_big_fil_rev_8_21_14_0_20_44_7]